MDFTGDPMIRLMPADASLVANLPVATMLGAPLLAPRLLDRDALEASTRRLSGIGVGSIDRAALSCGSSGCLAAVEGDLDELSGERLEASASERGLRIKSGEPRLLLNARSRLGPVGVRRLGEGVATLGDRDAVLQDGGSLDPARLQGRVPAGDLWAVVLDPLAFVSHAKARLRRTWSPDATQALVDLEAACRDHCDDLDGIDAIAVSVDLSASLVRLRVTCQDEGTARSVSRRLRLALAGRAWSPTGDEAVAEAADQAQVNRVGRRVEVTLDDAQGALARLLAPSEAAP